MSSNPVKLNDVIDGVEHVKPGPSDAAVIDHRSYFGVAVFVHDVFREDADICQGSEKCKRIPLGQSIEGLEGGTIGVANLDMSGNVGIELDD